MIDARRAIFLLAAVCAGPALAAEGPGLAISLARQPAAGFDTLGGASVVATEELQAALSWNSLSLDYQYTRYAYTGIASRDRDLHRLQFRWRFAKNAGDWRIRGYLAPGIATSSNIFKDFPRRGSSDDGYVSGRIEAGRGSKTRRWLLGIAYDRAFGEDRVYPTAGLEWRAAAALDVRLAFPDPGFRWRPAPRHTLTGRLFPSGFVWRVVSDDFSREFAYRTRGVRTQLDWSYRLWRQVRLDVGVAFETDRRHAFEDDAGNPLRSGAADEWLFTVGLRAGAARKPYAHGY